MIMINYNYNNYVWFVSDHSLYSYPWILPNNSGTVIRGLFLITVRSSHVCCAIDPIPTTSAKHAHQMYFVDFSVEVNM